MNGIRRFFVQFFFIVIVIAFPLLGQEAGKLSMMVTPGVNLPVGTPVEMFSLGGGAELSGIYSMPFASWLAAKGSLDYSLVSIASEDITDSLNLLTVSAGVGPVAQPAPWLTLYAFGSAGYGLGLYKGEAGGSAYLGAEGGASFNLSPAFSIGAGIGYRHYMSQPTPFYQGINIHLGTFIRFEEEQLKSNIEIYDIRLSSLYPVFYKHYDDHSLGNFTVKNSEGGAIKNLEVSLYIPQYMDSPKQCAAIETLNKDQTADIPLYALFSDNVLSITEGTKVAADITSSYTYRGKEITKKETLSLRLYDRNAMTWDDDRKAAAFVTAKDPGLLGFSKNIAGIVRSGHSSAVNLNFRIAMGLFEAMKLHGINYVVDPMTPYSDFSSNAATVDYLQFPIQTLEYKAGDCDDLSILYAALIESTGIESAFITVPGHIYAAVLLGISPDEAEKSFKSSGDLIILGGTVWLPVEITMIQQGFIKAWETGAKQWREHERSGNSALISVHEAWNEYEPVGLPGSSANISFPAQDAVMEQYTAEMNRFVEREITDDVIALESKIAQNREAYRYQNKLGVLYARYGLLDKAEGFFRTAANSQHVPAMINLGNLLYLKEEYEPALSYYRQADEIRPGYPTALIGIARANYELENFGTVKRTYQQLRQKDPAAAADLSYLVSVTDDTARASAAMERQKVIWAED